MKKSDIDLFELNEAFASVVLRYMQAFDIDPAKINVNGGAIALGHPLGATGAMILGTVLDELERTNKSTALVTLCIGGGMGTADAQRDQVRRFVGDRKSTPLNSSHANISYAVFLLKKKNITSTPP